MIKSAAIVKTKTLAPWKELRLQKRKLKKSQAVERKATKQVRPSPINKKPSIEETPTRIQEEPPTRSELETKATELNLKFDGRTPDKKLFKMIEESLKGQ
jgi:hypothetical protein